MGKREFEAVLRRPEGVGTWHYVDIPFDVAEAFGARGQVKVKGAVNGHPFRSSAMPHGDGHHYLVVNKAIRDTIGAGVGDVVQVSIEADSGERSIAAPADLAQALEGHRQARAAFAALSYSHKREYVEWVEGARQAETRQRRIAQALEMLLKGWTPKRRPR